MSQIIEYKCVIVRAKSQSIGSVDAERARSPLAGQSLGHVVQSKQTMLDQTMRTIQKKRTANFREDETRLLIQLWGSPSIQNKLFLTHRKAPVMRLLAANMQQRGFYRTPDEIKTRIRNLKCLYHRIKRSMSSGTGIGTVDPDWPHFKAMDEILSKEYPRKLTDRILEEQMETKFEDIKVKQEIDDIDIDDNDSWATNESVNSEYDDDASQGPASPAVPIVSNAKPLPPIQQGSIQVKKTSSLQAQPVQQFRVQAPVNAQATLKTHIPIQPALKPNTMVPTIQLPTSQVTQNGQIAGQKGGIPFPLLILNNVNHGDKTPLIACRLLLGLINKPIVIAANSLLKEVIELQKQNLELAKQHIEIEKQRLEFDRVIGTQMVTMLPMLGGVLQRLAYPGNQDLIDMKFGISAGVKRKRSASEDADVIKDSKKLRNMLEKGIRKYMLMDEDESQPEVVVEKLRIKTM
ncbi:uncharacterized protein [Atheta coriaria]|uniref:uncharacterized protein n=1 Tax=Dalotia coriaria TaxID=877792 RepID=UPI0031F46F90